MKAKESKHSVKNELSENPQAWKKWGPYLSERQWGTVREDYSSDGGAWQYLPHDHARSKAYRWGEDGIAGISDDQQMICLSLALWNGKDPILKERLFGLSGPEGNHGEDVKEYYYYLDGTPTHSYLKMLYKYPQMAFPYGDLVNENQRRGYGDAEYELLDTGAFDEDRYFDVSVEYAKASPDDIIMRVTAQNRGSSEAPLNLIPQLWFRNTWTWGVMDKPEVKRASDGSVEISHPKLGKYYLYAESGAEFIFANNETNVNKLYQAGEVEGHFKDAFHDYIVSGITDAINPAETGTKVGTNYKLSVPPHESASVYVRLSNKKLKTPLSKASQVFKTRIQEADEFYGDLQKDITSEDERNVQRQALGGMIWTKQFFYYDIPEWLEGDAGQIKPPAERYRGRNSEWMHLNNADIISMPDKWEYPWYAAWDLAFHCIPLAMIDPEFAKEQLVLMTREWYMHPNGQIPAYEWNFSDVNPPVHAWATWRVFQMDRKQRGDKGDLAFLERVFHKLMLNFTWWVNRKDENGNNIFQGGFLGLDNIGVFDRSSQLPGGAIINQADGTSWMAMYSLNLMRIALELAQHNPVYEDIATKFFEHFLEIAHAMSNLCGCGIGLWDDEDGFFYDVLQQADGHSVPLKIRSMVGLIPLFAVETLEPELLKKVPDFNRRLKWVMKYRPQLKALVSHWEAPGEGERRLLSLLRGSRMKSLLRRMLDESEFLSDFGIRALSKHHEENPYVFHSNGDQLVVDYQPAESNSGMFGGNSNWRGPIWFPVNYLIIESLQKFHHYYGDDFKIECPVGSGNFMTILEATDELSKRLKNLFLLDENGRRPAHALHPKMHDDPHFKNHILFWEYFHGDTGRGVGASHQTGWTGLVAKLIQPRVSE